MSNTFSILAGAFLLGVSALGARSGGPGSSSPSVPVTPGQSLQAAVDAHPAGTVFVLRAGVHRLQFAVPKDGDTFVGEAGTVLNGARLVAGFRREGSLWVAAASSGRREDYRGSCDTKHPACQFPEDLYFDDTPLQRAKELSAVSADKWYLDYDKGLAYISKDPDGHKVEIGTLEHAFEGGARNISIRRIAVEKYASLAGDGAIDARAKSGATGSGWTVEDNDIRLNHGAGIRLGDSMKVLRNKVHQNGQMGVGGSGANVVVEGNEIFLNNFAGYDPGWEAGGTKFTFCTNLVVRNNYVHDNKGPGLWTDIENENTLYDHNHTSSNQVAGILHEISFKAEIRDNLIENEGPRDPKLDSPWYGAGIVVSASSNVDVHDNRVLNCTNGIVGLQARRELSRKGNPYLLQHIRVHDNQISQIKGVSAGIIRAGLMSDDVFTAWDNRFTNNHFTPENPAATKFAWKNGMISLHEWQSEVDNH